MKKVHLKPWQLYVSMFILLLAIGVFMRWLDPRGMPWTDNLLQSLLGAVLFTVGFTIGDRYRRKNQKHREEVMKQLKDKEQWN